MKLRVAQKSRGAAANGVLATVKLGQVRYKKGLENAGTLLAARSESFAECLVCMCACLMPAVASILKLKMMPNAFS